mgnify:CR=1 FL=1
MSGDHETQSDEKLVTNVIDVREVRKTFDGITAVDGVSFSVPKGEFFGLLGPNGAGKTSTIRMVYDFSPITSGTVEVFDRDITTDWREIKSRIGVCQQENTLDPDLSVEQNLRVFAWYFNMPARKARQRTESLLDFFALGHRRKAKVAELSGGMARRLTLARALINEPELLILDEPTTGLDPQSRHQVWDKLEALKEKGLTTLLTTHYMEEASRLCDRLLIMDHGRVLVQGSPQGLIVEHAGHNVVEIEGGGEDLREFITGKGLRFDDLGKRLIIYMDDRDNLMQEIREKFCVSKCTFRNGTLEDVFLRLTGRELRE